MNKKASIELSVNFIVMLVLCIIIFGSSVYILKKFFSHAETIKMTFDERTELQIEQLLDDGSIIAIPFDRKNIYNTKFDSFGVGVLNVVNSGPENEFTITVTFNKAFDKDDEIICDKDFATLSPPELLKDPATACGNPNKWLQTTQQPGDNTGVSITKTIENNEQERFLIGVGVKGAPPGMYIFDLEVKYPDPDPVNLNHPITYDRIHKLYVNVPS